MLVVSQYTDPTLRAYLLGVLGPYAPILGWDSATAPLDGVVLDTVRLLQQLWPSVTDLPDAADPAVVEALGAVALWRRVEAALGVFVDLRTSEYGLTRSQMRQAAREAREQAEAAAARWLRDRVPVAYVSSIHYLEDPYGVRAGA